MGQEIENTNFEMPSSSNKSNEGFVADHVGISVADLEESIDWYDKHLGFKLENKYDFPSISSKIAFIKKDGFRIELFEHYKTHKLEDHRKNPLSDMQYQGVLHLCFRLESGLEQLFEKFINDGVECAMTPRKSPPGDAIMGFIRDNTGNLIEFIEPYKK